MTFAIALRHEAVTVREDIEIGDDRLPVKIRGELGVRPSIEVIHLLDTRPHTVGTWTLARAQEGSEAASWPAGTPLAFVAADAEPIGEATVHLAHPVSAVAYELNLQGCYRRLKIGSEILHEAQLVGERGPGYTFRFDRVERAREGTIESAHAIGAIVTALAPGES